MMTAMDNFVSKCVIVNTVNVIPLMVPACVILDGKERSATEVNSPMWEYIFQQTQATFDSCSFSFFLEISTFINSITQMTIKRQVSLYFFRYPGLCNRFMLRGRELFRRSRSGDWIHLRPMSHRLPWRWSNLRSYCHGTTTCKYCRYL